MDEIGKNFLDQLLSIPSNFFDDSTTAAQQQEPTSRKRPHEALVDVDASVEVPPKQGRKERVSPEPTGEEQNATMIKEMYNDVKLVVRTMQTMEQKVDGIIMHLGRVVEVLNKHLHERGQSSNATPTTVAEQLLPLLPPPSQSQLPAAEPIASQPPLTQNSYSNPPLQIPATLEVPIQQLPHPIAPRNSRFAALPSSDINRAKLKNVNDVLQKHANLLGDESKIGRLAVKLAREAIFGDDILKLCTPRGFNDKPALPQMELNHLKAVLFEQFPCFQSHPEQFEKLWATALTSVAQVCKRLRNQQ